MVEIPITATNATGINVDINFQQQPQLQSYNVAGQKVYIKAIQAFSNTSIATSPITTANPVASPGDLQNATLTLVEGDKEMRKRIPLTALNNSFGTGPSFVPPSQDLFKFRDLWELDWTKCYITLLSVPPSVPFSYLFGVHYSYEPDYD